MSAIATFYLFDTGKLGELVHNAEVTVKKSLFKKMVTDNFYDYLTANAKDLGDFPGSGPTYASVLVYIEDEKGIDLLHHPYEAIVAEVYAKRESTIFIFTNEHRKQYGELLDPANYTVEELRSFNKEFSDDGDEETAQSSMDAIRLLHRHLYTLDGAEQVLLLLIG